ncbi:MAG: transglycosylase SLT domain-containing protein [Ignavibacteriales bacterium]|nr:transglycosylase SLT domain-containing protein [Ignavibacteriales bacterium]
MTRAHRREPRGAHPQGQPAARGRAQRVPGEVRPRDGVRQHDGEALSREHDVREAGHLRGRAEEVPGRWSSYFQKYGEQYQLDYLLMAAQGYQESQLDQNAKSQVGAIGVMQVMPATGKEHEGRRHHADRGQHPRRREVHAVRDRPVLQGRAHGPAEQGPVRLRVLQRGAGAGPPAAQGSGEARARPERLVRQRGADRVRAHRAGNRHLREQHLQVLHRLPAALRGARQAGRRESREDGGRRAVGARVAHLAALALEAGQWNENWSSSRLSRTRCGATRKVSSPTIRPGEILGRVAGRHRGAGTCALGLRPACPIPTTNGTAVAALDGARTAEAPERHGAEHGNGSDGAAGRN